MPSDSWALYGSIAVGSVMPSRNVPPGLPATGGRSWVSGKPTEAWLPPPFDPVLDFWLHPVRTIPTTALSAMAERAALDLLIDSMPLC